MKFIMILIPTFIITVLYSCSPEVKHPELNVQFPEKWVDSTQAVAYIDSAWWQDFGDENIDSLIALAFKNNYSLQAAVGRLEAAEAQATIAGADLYPSLSVGGSGARQKRSLVGFPSSPNFSLPEHLNTFGVSANVSWELDLWGKVRNARSAAVANFEASLADYNGFKLSLTAQTIKAWFAAIDATRQRHLAESNYKSYQQSEERVLARYEKGLRGSLDYRLSRTSVANAEYQYLQRVQQEEQAKRQIEIILGKFPAAKIAVSEKLPEEIEDIPAGIPADLLSRRPDIIAAERRLASAQCNVSAAKAAMFPSISLTASAGTSTKDLADILNQDFSIWNIAANVLQPIFQGGRLRANVRLNEAQQKQAFANYADIVLKAYAEIESILAAEQYLKKQEQAIRIASEEAKASLDLAEDRYYNGLSDMITMLESRRQYNNAESQLLNVQRIRLENRVDFYVALGGAIRG